MELATQAASDFHTHAVANDVDAILEGATQGFRDKTSREMLQGMLARIRRKLGACPVSQPNGNFVNMTPGGTYVTTSFTMQCAKGQLGETFSWRIQDGKAILSSYNAGSPLLVTD